MNEMILLSMPGGGELIIILVIVLLLFGANRIPEVAKGLGKGIREFKSAMRDVQSEIDNSDKPKAQIDKPKQDDSTKAEKKE